MSMEREPKKTAASPYSFKRPPEAPVFEPTEEEFANPYAFFSRIKPTVDQTGICRVIPPAGWQPPFAVDVDKFRFTPRIQRLGDLEGRSRVKILFFEKLSRFWRVQGVKLKFPWIASRYLDLYELHTIVKELGGFEQVCRDRLWARVCSTLNLPLDKGFGYVIKSHYEKWLYAYDVFLSGATTVDASKKQEEKSVLERGSYLQQFRQPTPTPPKDGESPRSDSPSQSQPTRSKTRLMAARTQSMESTSSNEELPDAKTVGAKRKKRSASDPTDNYVCTNCARGDSAEYMLLCERCDSAHHTFCLIPPLSAVPKGDWCCPKCVSEEFKKANDAYGFEQSQRQYTLHAFGEKADAFKADYFKMPVHMVPTESVEQEFWRLVARPDLDVSVEYGADVHAKLQGSGFPTKATCHRFKPEDVDPYVDHPWNLTNLAMIDSSILRFIHADITGMKVPWCYVGMVFSAFCWHVEDHWSYSVNYMHWGEPKTWYGVPAYAAPKLEACIRKYAPELFEDTPDLLHHITVTHDPQKLIAAGVPVVRTDQQPGQFVITFPRAYHAGFNNGYNFAEAVNYCPAEWLPIGRLCVENYRLCARQCVFSHNELVCKMASDPNALDLVTAAACYREMLVLIDTEKRQRRLLLEMGVRRAEREMFELLPDDQRQCSTCHTTCFLSALSCLCKNGRNIFEDMLDLMGRHTGTVIYSTEVMVCLSHTNQLPCSCTASSYVLRYRYTLDELPRHLERLKARAHVFDTWAQKVRHAIRPSKRRSKKEVKSEKMDVDAIPPPQSSTKNATENGGVDVPTLPSSKTEPTASDVNVKTEPPSLDPSASVRLEKPSDKVQLSYLKSLLDEAEKQKFPETELLVTLRLTVRECEKCAHVATQLLRHKDKVRTRNHPTSSLTTNGAPGGGSVENACKLTFDELTCFVQQVARLPCHVEQITQLQAMVDEVQGYKDEAIQLLAELSDLRNSRPPSRASASADSINNDRSTTASPVARLSERVKNLLLKVLSTSVELPEVLELREKTLHAEWLEEVDAKLAVPPSVRVALSDTPDPPKANESYPASSAVSGKDLLSLSAIRSLVARGAELSREGANASHAVTRALRQLRMIEHSVEELEDRTKQLLTKKNPKPSVNAIRELRESAGALPPHVAVVRQLDEIRGRAGHWLARYKKLFSGGEEIFAHLDQVESLLGAAHQLPVSLEPFRKLQLAASDGRSWLEQASKTFVVPGSGIGLLELLCCRNTELESLSKAEKSRKRTAAGSLASKNKESHWTPLLGGVGSAQFDTLPHEEQLQVFTRERQQECALMHSVRALNLAKLDGPTRSLCPCGVTSHGSMIDCDLCCEWYHLSCAGVSTCVVVTSSQVPALSPPRAIEKNGVWLCASCARSKRPRAPVLLQLLVQLKTLPIMMSEGDALVSMVYYMIAWQDKVATILNDNPQLKSAYDRIDALQKAMESGEVTDPSLYDPPSFVPESRTETDDKQTENLKSHCADPDKAPIQVQSISQPSTHSAKSDVAAALDAARQAAGSPPVVASQLPPQTSNRPLPVIPFPSPDASRSNLFDRNSGFLANISSESVKPETTVDPAAAVASASQPQLNSSSGVAISLHPIDVSTNQVPAETVPCDAVTTGAADASQTASTDGASALLKAGISKTRPSSSPPAGQAEQDQSTSKATPPQSMLSSGPSSPSRLSGSSALSSPLVLLSQSVRAELTNLMVSGLLLELKLDETAALWLLLRASEPARARHNIRIPYSASELSTLRASHASASSASFGGQSSSEAPKKKKKTQHPTGEEGEPGAASKPRKKPGKDKLTRVKKTTTSSEGKAEQVVCAAGECRMPSGGHVDWIACDTCLAWYHMLCEGVDSHSLAEDDDYFCRACQRKKHLTFA